MVKITLIENPTCLSFSCRRNTISIIGHKTLETVSDLRQVRQVWQVRQVKQVRQVRQFLAEETPYC